MKNSILDTFDKWMKYKNFIFFTFLFSLEKGLLWIFPLFFLYLYENESLYSQLELILSITAIINVVIDFGLNTYASYSNKNRGAASFQLSFSSLLIILSLTTILTILYQTTSGFKVVVLVVFCRLIYFALYRFMITYYRWNKNPILPILLNSMLYGIFMLSMYLIENFKQYLFIYFNSSSILEIIALFYLSSFLIILFFLLRQIKILIRQVPEFFIDCLKYSWPLVLITILNMLLPNLAKIFAYNIDHSLMAELSQILRYCITIQLLHGSFNTFFYKKIFQEMNFSILNQYIKLYISIMILASFICFNVLFTFSEFNINAIIIGVLYIFIWCIASFCEIFFSRAAHNITILIGGLISLFIYLFLFMYIRPDNVNDNLNILLITSAVYFLYLIINIYIRRDKFFNDILDNRN